MKLCQVCVFLILSLAALPAAAQENRVVALVVAVGQQSGHADTIQTRLQAIGAETLRANDPNSAELRTIVTRFAREAANSRAAFVYIDAPIVDFQDQSFVLPAGATLRRSTDLFTQALPLMAFSRSAGQAGQGGATIATLGAISFDLPDGTTPTTGAFGTASPLSPILVAPARIFPEMAAIFDTELEKEEVEVRSLLESISALDGVTVTEFAQQPIYLREKQVEQITAASLEQEISIPAIVPDEGSSRTASTGEAETDVSQEPVETLAELSFLEQSLSRAAKRSIQTRLRSLGIYSGLVDGIFGPQTRAAIAEFQGERNEDRTGVLTRRQLIDLSS